MKDEKLYRALLKLLVTDLVIKRQFILFLMIFLIYVSDLEDWLDFLIALTYADDTITSVSAPSMEEVIRRLEIDAKNVLA